MQICFFYREGGKGNILIGIDFTESSEEAGRRGEGNVLPCPAVISLPDRSKNRPSGNNIEIENIEPIDLVPFKSPLIEEANIGVMLLLVIK
jgi:hypothetical protein